MSASGSGTLCALAMLLVVPCLARAQSPAPARSALTLHEAVQTALAWHPSVAAARDRLAGAEAGASEVRAARLPSLATAWSVTTFEEPMVVAPLHGFDPQAPPDFDETLILGQTTLSYTLFDGGGRGARIRQSAAGVGSASAGVESAESRLITAVTEAYLRVLTLRDVRHAELRRIEALSAEQDRVSRFLAEGRAPRVELLRAEAALSQSEADRATVDARLEVGERELARLLGAPTEEVRGRVLEPVGLLGSLEEAAAPAVTPEVEGARRRVEAAEARAEAERAAWFPRLETVAGFNEFGSGAGDFTGEWQAALRVSYPIFTGGARTSAIRRAEADLRAAREELRLAELRAESDVDRAGAAVVEADARIEALAAAVAQFEEVARIEALALAAGAGVQRDLLQAEASLFGARAALAESRHAGARSRIELARARGVLTLSWLRDNVESER